MVIDSNGKINQPFPHSKDVMKYFFEKQILMSVVSTTTPAREVGHLIYLFGWNIFFSSKQIYKGSITTHLNW